MTIDKNDPRLTAFALDELPREETAELQAALKNDPALQAEVDAIRAVADKLKTTLAEEPLPKAVTELVATLEKAGEQPNTFTLKKRIFTMKSITKIAVAATILLAIGGVFAWTLSSDAFTSVALAQVAKNLNQAQTISLKKTVYQGEELRSEQTISLLNADRMRVESEGSIGIFDWAQGKMLSLAPQHKQAIAVTLKDAKKSGPQRNWLAELKKIVGSEKAREIGTETFENRPCKGWQVTNSMGVTTVWADEKTAEIVRVEIKAGIVRTVLSNFKFNPKLDESQFSLKMPDGYEMVVDTSFAPKDTSEDDVVLLLRAWAGGNGDVFPDSLTDGVDWFKAAARYDWSKEKKDENTLNKKISMAFFQIYAKQNWVYRGKGVKLGTPDRAIFWYKPKGSKNYRVIYADLSVKEVAPDELKGFPEAGEN